MFEVTFLPVDTVPPDLKMKFEETISRYSGLHVSNSHSSSDSKIFSNLDFKTNFLLGLKVQASQRLIGIGILKIIRETDLASIIFVSEEFQENVQFELLINLSQFTFEVFPSYGQELWNPGGKCLPEHVLEVDGFKLDRKESTKGAWVYQKNFPANKNVEFLRKSDLHVISHDAGGAFQISALMSELSLSGTASLKGPAMSIFQNRNPGIKNVVLAESDFRDKTLLFGSGFYGGFESSILESLSYTKNLKVVLLDHWMNYKARFNPTNAILPDIFLVTNELAHQKALSAFPDVQVTRIHDFLLAEYRRDFGLRTKRAFTLLLILEPDAGRGEGLGFQIGKLDKYLKVLLSFARRNEISSIVIRRHPSQSAEDIQSCFEATPGVKLEFSSSESLIGDIQNARAVFGFHSYALYASSMLGVETFSFFASEKDHWTYWYPEIKETSPIEIL
jgi:hypothetical protein